MSKYKVSDKVLWNGIDTNGVNPSYPQIVTINTVSETYPGQWFYGFSINYTMLGREGETFTTTASQILESNLFVVPIYKYQIDERVNWNGNAVAPLQNKGQVVACWIVSHQVGPKGGPLYEIRYWYTHEFQIEIVTDASYAEGVQEYDLSPYVFQGYYPGTSNN